MTGAVESFTAVEGQNTGTIVLATFEDPNTLATASSVTASLPIGGWGDTTPAASATLAVQQIGLDPTTGDPIFEVLGSHTYAEEGTYTVNINVTTSGGVTTALTAGTATVLDAPLTGSAGTEITGVEGSSTGTVLLGTFVDANQLAPPSPTIPRHQLGRRLGTRDAPQTPTSPRSAPRTDVWEITAAYTYTEEGTYAYTVTVTDDGGADTVVSGSAIIADAALTPGPATSGRVDGSRAPITTVVGSFTDANPRADLRLHRRIDWATARQIRSGRSPSRAESARRLTLPVATPMPTPGVYAISIVVKDVAASRHPRRHGRNRDGHRHRPAGDRGRQQLHRG